MSIISHEAYDPFYIGQIKCFQKILIVDHLAIRFCSLSYHPCQSPYIVYEGRRDKLRERNLQSRGCSTESCYKLVVPIVEMVLLLMLERAQYTHFLEDKNKELEGQSTKRKPIQQLKGQRPNQTLLNSPLTLRQSVFTFLGHGRRIQTTLPKYL